MTDTEKQARELELEYAQWCATAKSKPNLYDKMCWWHDRALKLAAYGSSEYERGRKAEVPERWDEDTCKRFEQAPCFLCGYSGEGYFQPDKHSCAQLYHRGQTETVKEAYERGLRDGREQRGESA